MAQRCLGINPVKIAAPIARALEYASLFKLGHDPLDPTFGQSNLRRHIAQRLPAIGGQTNEDMGVVAQERPTARLHYIRHCLRLT